MPYNFTSPAAAAGDAIQQLLLQREQQKRQAMLDELNRRQAEAQMAAQQESQRLARERFGLEQSQDAYGRQRDTTLDTRHVQERTEDRANTIADELRRRGYTLEDTTSERQFRTGEREASQKFTAGQNALGRQNAVDIAGMRAAASGAGGTADTKTNNAMVIFGNIKELANKVVGGSGVAAKAAGMATRAGAAMNLSDPSVNEYESMISGFTPLVARALGHTGVLTELDVQSVRALFPQVGDSTAVRDAKLARVEKIMGEMNGGGSPIAPMPSHGESGSGTPDRDALRSKYGY